MMNMFGKPLDFLRETINSLSDNFGVSSQLSLVLTIIIFAVLIAFLVKSIFIVMKMRIGTDDTDTTTKSLNKRNKVEVNKSDVIMFGYILPIIMIVSGILNFFV